MTIWFTSDPHFDHERIIKLSNRPFANVGEMNRHILNSYNTHVKTNDELFILGDFGWGDAASLKYWRSQIRCEKIHFIWGNHDGALKKNDGFLGKTLFKTFGAEWIGNISGQNVHMYHYPILEWDAFFRDSWHLFGHVHGNRPHLPGFLGYDVGVDVNNYEPISFEQIKEKMFKIKERALRSPN